MITTLPVYRQCSLPVAVCALFVSNPCFQAVISVDEAFLLLYLLIGMSQFLSEQTPDRVHHSRLVKGQKECSDEDPGR